MNPPPIKLCLCMLLALICAAGSGSARADETVDVTINTAGLGGQPGSELFLDLTGGGSDGGTGFNTATFSNFTLGGGTAGADNALKTFGNVSGDLTSTTLSINDRASPFNQFAEFLTPGSQLSFQLTLTNNVNSGPVPDGLFLYLYGPSGNPLATTSDPSGFDSLLEIDFNTATPPISNYDKGLVTVASVSTSVPEPDTLLLSALGGALLAAHAALRRRRELLRR